MLAACLPFSAALKKIPFGGVQADPELLHVLGAAAILLYFAPNYPLLLTGRVMYGLGIGFAMHAAPAYIAETAPASVRGLLIR